MSTQEELASKMEFERMLKNSQTKIIMPVITLGLLQEYALNRTLTYADADIRKLYEATVRQLRDYLGHSLHLGAKYYDAYSGRMSRYKVLEQISHLK